MRASTSKHKRGVMPQPNPSVTHRFHGRCAWDPDCPHIPTLVFSAHFVLTRAHPRSTSRSVTHPKTTPSLARLTWESFPDGLPEKKVHLVDMSSLSFLLNLGCYIHHPSKEPTSLSAQRERSHRLTTEPWSVRLGSRLSSHTNTSLFCTLFPHSCAHGINFPVGHPS